MRETECFSMYSDYLQYPTLFDPHENVIILSKLEGSEDLQLHPFLL